MSVMSIWSTVNNLGSLALGGTSQKRQVIMSCEDEKFTFPVTPAKFEVRTTQNNKTVDIIDFGEAMLFGNPGLIRLEFSTFFPRTNHAYPFVVGDQREAEECVEQMIKWKEGKKPVRLIITDSPINHMFGIKAFDYDNHDCSRDIYFTLSLIEYKDLNVPPANNDKQVNEDTGLKNRPQEKSQPVSTDKMKKARDILEMSKKAYGTVSKWRSIAQSNDLKNLAINSLAGLKIGKR